MMKNELNHFYIDRFVGGSQDWMPDAWMRLGGCAALAAVDSMIYFTLCQKKKKLCPPEIDVKQLNKSIYITFAMIMKPYLRPRFMGVNKLHLYTDGVKQYMKKYHIDSFTMEHFPTGQSLDVAQDMLIRQIDAGMIIPFLLLNPISKEWKDYHWHWFLLSGYEWRDDRIYVKVITYGNYQWLSFDGLWNTTDPDNGGMILYQF